MITADYQSFFDNKVVLITGGTGSFGSAMIEHLLKYAIAEIRIFSRDEKKQEDYRQRINDSRLKFIIGDIRDRDAVNKACVEVDYIFHAAALKQIPSCESHPLEAYKTNIFGTENLLEAAIEQKVKHVICLSTDKAVYPINAMGLSKACMEKLAVAKALESRGTTKINCTRYGNILASRGSVVPVFLNQIERGLPLQITDTKMTRFILSLEQAIELVLFAFTQGRHGNIFVRQAKAIAIITLAQALLEILGQHQYPIDIVGIRNGEKFSEMLINEEELMRAEIHDQFFSIMPQQHLLYSTNENQIHEGGYHSENCPQLAYSDLKTMLWEIPEVRALKYKLEAKQPNQPGLNDSAIQNNKQTINTNLNDDTGPNADITADLAAGVVANQSINPRSQPSK